MNQAPLSSTNATQYETWLLFSGVVGVLTLATIIGAYLKWRLGVGANSRAIDNLNARIRAWWVVIALIGVAFALGRIGTIVLFALASLLALREFFTLAPTHRGDHKALLFAYAVVVPVQYFLVWAGWVGLFTIFIPVCAFLILPIVSALAADTKHFLERAAVIQWGLMVAVYCIAHVPALLTLDIPGYQGRNLLLVGFLILIVQASDVLQYIWGKLCGRRQIAPVLSPSKTLAGTLGGVLSASALGAALWWVTPFTPLQAFAISLVTTLMGFFGGLVMSAIKRDRGVKDWGALIQGHGGVLDRLDSICFAAPVFFHITRYGWAP